MTERVTLDDYPSELWVYNRSGKLEARADDIVVGNVRYIRIPPNTFLVTDDEATRGRIDDIVYELNVEPDECRKHTEEILSALRKGE